MDSGSPDRVKKYLENLAAVFSFQADAQKALIKTFHAEMEKGLAGEQSSLKMLPAFIGLPTGRETGRFLALDLGGTNFRILASDLLGQGKSNVFAVDTCVIPRELTQGTGQQLFDFVADSIQIFFAEYAIDTAECYDLAFTFSFPVRQTKINSGELITWTKGFAATDVEGRDVMSLLQAALHRKGIDYVRPVALVNDTVGTLASKSYGDRACDTGVILGTGMNSCYLEQVENIRKLHGMADRDQMIINKECGNFDKIEQSPFDRDMDMACPRPGTQRLEKMVSGMYLGEIFRTIIFAMIQRGLVLQNAPTISFALKGCVKTRHMSRITADDSAELSEVAKLLQDNGIGNAGLEDRVAIRDVCNLVGQRSATIAATVISAIVTWMDPDLTRPHTVGVDGSLFGKYPGYQDIMNNVLAGIHGPKKTQIRLQQAKDGSGKGAAVIAAMAAEVHDKTRVGRGGG